MARRRTIVGLGEALLSEQADREEPAGLALLVPVHAVRLGHVGIAISRLGQDRAARVLTERLRALGVEVAHLQYDPDLPTGRAPGTSGARGGLDAQAAYDNLQWDFDLADVAQEADAVVFGARARRTGQTRSTCDRFLAECRRALRLFDLTNRSAEGLLRSLALPALFASEAAAVDGAALEQLRPGAAARPARDTILELIRQADLAFVLHCEPGEPPVLHNAESSWKGMRPYRREAHEACIAALLHAVLAGWGLLEALRLAERVAAHALEQPQEPPPQELLQRA